MKKLVLFLLVIMYTSIILAGTLYPVKQGDPIYFSTGCSNDTSVCDACNITSITYPNSSVIVGYSNVPMTRENNVFNITILGNYTMNVFGNIRFQGLCTSGYQVQVWTDDVPITNSGYEKPNSGEGLSLVGLYGLMILVSGFFLIIAWMSENQVVKSMFIGLSAFIMAMVVFFGMTTVTQILGGFGGLAKGYNTFFFFMVLVIVIAVFATLIFVLIRSMNAMKIRRGDLDPDKFEM
jgi:hypothetical protein